MAVVKGEATGRSARERLGVGSGREKKEERIPCLVGDIDLERRGLTPPGSRRDIRIKKEKCWGGEGRKGRWKRWAKEEKGRKSIRWLREKLLEHYEDVAMG